MDSIKFAAIVTDNCIIYGRDHARCINKAVKLFGEKTYITQRQQGFLTRKFRFVKRQEAAKIAFDYGQILKWKNGQILLSEELWGHTAQVPHDYDKVTGYMRKP